MLSFRCINYMSLPEVCCYTIEEYEVSMSRIDFKYRVFCAQQESLCVVLRRSVHGH